MDNNIAVAIIAFCGTLIGTFGGIVTSNKMVNYRLEQLEKKVDKHNSVIERTFRIEEKQSVFDEKIKVVNNRIKDLEERS